MNSTQIAPKPNPPRRRPLIVGTTKWCPNCKAYKPFDDFNRCRTLPGGVSHYCRPCESARNRARYKRTAVSNFLREIDPAYQKRCAGCQQMKYASEFTRARGNPDGLAHYCIPCRKARRAKEGERRRSLRVVIPPDYHKRCCACDIVKPAADFCSSRHAADGLVSRCRPCSADWRHQRKNNLRLQLRQILGNARQRGRKLGIGNDLDLDHLLELWRRQNGRCALTGLKMLHCSSQHGSTTFYLNVSADRIDNGLGYLKGNVHLVTNWANRAKATLSVEEFHRFCGLVVRHAKQSKRAGDSAPESLFE